MNTIVRIFVFSILIFGVFGGYENTCRDINNYCVKGDNCMNPAYYFQCAKTCGCIGKTCLELNPDCLQQSLNCINGNERRCPRFCGVCEGCDNLVHFDICKRYSHRCNEYNVRYLCAQTCGKCNESCRNKLASDEVCNDLHKHGYCERDSPYISTMRDVCRATCTSGRCY